MEYHWMKKTGLIFALILATAVWGCGSDDPTDPGGGGGSDTTPPVVQQTTPVDRTLMVQTNQPLAIMFNEPMDPTTAAGNITLSHGTVGMLSWTGDSVLNVTHSEWPEATRVTVTVGAGLKDVAGNALAAPVDVTYGTWSDNLFVFGTTPAGGATEINRAAPIVLNFGAPMIEATIETGITIDDGSKAPLSFMATSPDQGTWFLDPTESLPANTEITVTIGTSVMSTYETSFPAPYVFSFMTNDQEDDTAPTIVSLDPANGSIMPANQGSLMITFNEPINPDNFRPTSMNGQLAWLLMEAGDEPSWNGTGDVLTVPLPANLPAGLPMEVVFANYSDMAGNIQTNETPWSCTVAGTAAPYPVADGMQALMIGDWAEGLPGSETPTDMGQEWIYTQFTSRPTAGQWNDEEWFDPGYTMLDYYEIQTVSAAGVNIIGFAEEDQKSFTEIFLSGPATLVEFPLVQGNTWSDNVSATLPDGTMDIEVDGEVVGRMDVFAGEFDGIDITWTDVWKVDFVVDLSFEGTALTHETTETWYAPGIGVVREKYREDSVEEGSEGWSTYDRWLSLGFGD